jgi:hydroxyethylthiazole kinase-like uncharacterized protein yjeF
MPLPVPGDGDDKDARGRVLVIGGSVQVPGAVLLAGVAALRSGAGKLQLATVRSVTSALGVALPEALVVTLPESRAGEIVGSSAARALTKFASKANAVLIGPGITSERATRALIAALVRKLREDAVLVLDAAAITAVRHDGDILRPLEGRAVLTPHAGEMATLLGVDKREVEADPASIALHAAQRLSAVVALKGAESWIASPEGELLHYTGGNVGLATSGSGDTLAGIVAGLSARGATAMEAAAWSVFLHGSAGNVLSRRTGPIGFLARELLDEIPALMRAIR